MAVGLTQRQLQGLAPCEESYDQVVGLLTEARKWGNRKVTAAEAIEAGVSMYCLTWVAVRLREKKRTPPLLLSNFFADCATRALQNYEAKVGVCEAARKAITRLRTVDHAAAPRACEYLWSYPEVIALGDILNHSAQRDYETVDAFIGPLRRMLLDMNTNYNTTDLLAGFPKPDNELAWQRARFAAWFSDTPPKPLRFPPKPKPAPAVSRKKATAKAKGAPKTAKTRNR